VATAPAHPIENLLEPVTRAAVASRSVAPGVLKQPLNLGERKMGFHRDGQRTIVQIGLKCGANITSDRLVSLFGERTERRQRRGGELIGNQRLRRWEAGGFDRRADVDVAEPGFLHEGAELGGIAEGEWRPPVRGRLGAHVSLQCLHQGGHAGVLLDRAPDAERQPSGRNQDTAHLAQRGRAIRELLETMLAEHDVERRIGEGHLQRACFQPLDAGAANRREPAGHREHRGIDIQLHHPPRRPDSLGGEAGHHAGTARHIQKRESTGTRPWRRTGKDGQVSDRGSDADRFREIDVVAMPLIPFCIPNDYFIHEGDLELGDMLP
jgi:hypothetical protein